MVRITECNFVVHVPVIRNAYVLCTGNMLSYVLSIRQGGTCHNILRFHFFLNDKIWQTLLAIAREL